MAALGPIVVVTENKAADLVDVLGKAGAFPIVEASIASLRRWCSPIPNRCRWIDPARH